MTDSAETTDSSEPTNQRPTPTRDEALTQLVEHENLVRGYHSAVNALLLGIGGRVLSFEARLNDIDATEHGVKLDYNEFEGLGEVEESANDLATALWRTVRSAQVQMEDSLRAIYAIEPGLLLRASQLDDAVRDLRATFANIDTFEKQHRQALADYFGFTEFGQREDDQRRSDFHLKVLATTNLATKVIEGHLSYLAAIRNPGAQRMKDIVARIFGDDAGVEVTQVGSAMISVNLGSGNPSRFISDIIRGL
jgi:hypothetical protein